MPQDGEYEARVVEIQKNLSSIEQRMAIAAEKSGRAADAVQLVAVTKLMPLETIKAGIDAGIRNFGENYPEQAADKIAALETDKDVIWHMIGHIQSRKADTVCQYFDIVHSVDRMKIARYLDRYSRDHHKVMPILIEVNVSGEESKYGWQASNEADWSELLEDFRKIAERPNIEIQGLMSMPPLFDDPELTRPIYQKLRRLQQYLRDELPDHHWDQLSIGTSFDYEVAIEEGATIVRIGTELFGPRPTG